MGDKAKDAFKTAFRGFAAKPPSPRHGASAGPNTRDLSPSGATDGSAHQAEETPLSKKEKEEQRKKNEEEFKRYKKETSGILAGSQQGQGLKPNVADQGTIGQPTGAHTQSQTPPPAPLLRLDMSPQYQKQWEDEKWYREQHHEDGNHEAKKPPQNLLTAYESHVAMTTKKKHKNANPITDYSWRIFRDVLGSNSSEYRRATGRQVRYVSSAIKIQDSMKIPLERDPRNSRCREHGILGPADPNSDWLLAGPEEFPTLAWLSPLRIGAHEVPSEFEAHMPKWCDDWGLSMKVFMEKKMSMDVPLVLSTVMLGGAKDEQELFESLGYPIDMESEIVGKENWSFRMCLEAFMNEERTVRNGAGIVHWLCQVGDGTTTTWNGGFSGAPVVASLGTNNKLTRYQAMKAYVVRVCMEFPELNACERKFIQMTSRPFLSIGPGNPSSRNELRAWQLIHPDFMWAPQTRMGSVMADMKARGFLWNAGYVRFVDVVKSTNFKRFMKGFDAEFFPREGGKPKFYFLTPEDALEEEPAADAPEHCGYDFAVKWNESTTSSALSQNAVHQHNVAEQSSGGPPTGAHKQSKTPNPVVPTHTMPQDILQHHTIGGDGRYRYPGEIFKSFSQVNPDDGWKERRDTERKDEMGTVVRPAISIAGGFRCIAAMCTDAIAHFFRGWRTISQSLVDEEKKENSIYSYRMTHDQDVRLRANVVKNSGEPGMQLFPSILPGSTYQEQMASHEASRHATKLSGEKPKKLRRQEDRVPLFAKGRPMPTESQILEMENGSRNPWDDIGVTYSLPDEEGNMVTRPVLGKVAAHRALCAQYVARTSGLSTVPYVFMDKHGATMDGVYMQVTHSTTTPMESSQVGFTGVPTGLIFVGWVTPATRDSSTLASFATQGKSLAPVFDAYTPVGHAGPLTPDMLVSDMRPARLPSTICDILSTVFGQFLTHQTGSWRANLQNRGIEYWANAGRLEEGCLSLFGDWSLPWTAEWRCMIMSLTSMNIPKSVQPVFIVDEAWLMYNGKDPRELYPRDNGIVENSVVDINAPRGIPQNTSTGAKQLWQHNPKRLWGINAEEAAKVPTAPLHVTEMGKVATCVRVGAGGRYYFEFNKNEFTMGEINEHERMLYATHPVERPLDPDLTGFEELEATVSGSESAYAIFVKGFLKKTSRYCIMREVRGLKKYYADPTYDALPIIDLVHGPGFAELRPERIYRDIEYQNANAIPPNFLCPMLPHDHIMHFLKTNKFLREFLRTVYPEMTPVLSADVIAEVNGMPTIKSAMNAEALLTPVSIATEWEALKATLMTLKARHTVAETRDSLDKVFQFMDELQRHPGTFMYMRTYEQIEPKTLVAVLQAMQRDSDIDLNIRTAATPNWTMERVRKLQEESQLAVITRTESDTIVQGATPEAMIKTTSQTGLGGLFVTHWEMSEIIQVLDEADNEEVSSEEDAIVAPNSKAFLIDGRGLMLTGQHKVGPGGKREVECPHAKFPGLTYLRITHDLSYRDIHRYTEVLIEYLQPFLNFLASEMRRATVSEGLIPTLVDRNAKAVAIRNARELINERCAMATHLVLCSSDIWVNPNVDQVSTAWRRGTMFGCTTPGVPRSHVDMPLEEAYNAMFSKELKSFGAFLDSLNRRPEQAQERLALEDEAF